MAARARVRFSSSGAKSITGAFGNVGGSAFKAHSKVGKFGSGVGSIFYKVMRNVGRMTMFSAGLQQMGKSASGAKRDMQGFAAGTVTSLSAVSKKFAELRRQYYFFKFAGQKLAAPFKWMTGVTKKEEPAKKAAPSRWIDRVKAADPSSKEVEKATSAWQKFLAVLRGGGGVFSNVAKRVLNVKNVLTVLIASLTAVSLAGGIAFVVIGYQTAKFAKRVIVDFMSIREAFRQYEISLGGIIKNTYALGKVMSFATKYAAEYPAMFEDVLDTFRSLAALPVLKPMFQRADEQDLKRLMDIIQGLATLDPLQGVRGAGIALREALSGDMRSVRRRFEIPAKAIAEAGGYALEEITQDSQKALKAFHAFIKLNVPAKSMADAAMTIAIQVGNLRDKYRTFVNDMMKSTGAYWEVVTAIKSVNDWLHRVFSSDVAKQFGSSIGNSIRAFVGTLTSLMSGIDWDKYIRSGDLVSGMVEAAGRIAAFMRAMADTLGPPFLEAVSKISKILWKGLVPVIGVIASAIWILFVDGAEAAGKAAASAFIVSFLGVYTVSGTSEMRAASDAAMKKLRDDARGQTAGKLKKIGVRAMEFLFGYKPASLETPDISIDDGQIVKDVKDTKDKVAKTLDEMVEEAKAKFKELLGIKSPEIVTPELPLEQHKWIVQNLKTQLAASERLNKPLKERKGLIYALVEAEKALTRAKGLVEWEKEYAGDRETALKQMKEYEKAIGEARKAGENLSVEFYVEKGETQKALDNFDELYGKIVDQKDAFKELQSAVKSALGSMEGWTEKYKIGKKDAGALLIVTKKIQDILAGKVPATNLLALLKKRVELTDRAVEKEKELKKKVLETAKAISQSLTSMVSGIQSTMLSFTDKLKEAFIGIAPFAGPEPAKGEKRRRTAAERKQESRQLDFGRRVMEKIKDIMMIPANIFGLGREKMTYGQGYGRGEYWQGQGQLGGQIPPYIKFMLEGIKKAMAMGLEEGKGIAEHPAGRKALAEMRMGLLEKAIPYTPYRSEARAEIYAKMAGAQADIMKSTLQATLADIQMQKDQLTAAQNTANNTSMAIDKSNEVIAAIHGISTQAQAVPKSSPSVIGNEKMSDLNPAMGAAY